MKLLLLSLALIPTFVAPALANEITGAYYTPFFQYPDSNDFQPESIHLINADGTYENRVVHDGKQEVRKGEYSVNGSQVTFKKGTYIATCPNVTNYGDDEDLTVNWARSATELTLSLGDEKQTLKVATEEEKKKVLDLPACGK